MMINDAGSTLTEYALIAALVSIVILAVSADLGFPGAPVAALSEVASGPRGLESQGLGSETQVHPQGGWSFAGEASGSGSLRGAGTKSAVPIAGAGASGSAQGTWIEPTVTASPRPRDPAPYDQTLLDMDAAMTATPEQADNSTGGANSVGPGAVPTGWPGRQSRDRSTGGGTAAENRRVSPRRPAQRPDPAAEQLVSLRPGGDADVLTVGRASVGETAGTARGETAREIRTRAISGLGRQPAGSAEARGTDVTSTFRMGDRRLWALVVLMLVGLGFGARRLRRRFSGGPSVADPKRQ